MTFYAYFITIFFCIYRRSKIQVHNFKDSEADGRGGISEKNNWMPVVKLSTCTILDNNYPPVILGHFVLCVVHALKVYGQYGEVTKRYETACKVINYGLSVNKVVVSNRKVGGQRL